jgi:hypothetical protein
MNRIGKIVSLVAFFALLSAGPAFTQIPSDEATPEARAAAPVAYVYVQALEGVVAFSAAADGKLVQLEGSPFAIDGQMVGSDGKYLISAGTYSIYSYAVEPNGAIGKQISTINTQDYAPASCADTGASNANLDHTGREVYVEIGLEGSCGFVETLHIAKDSGELTYGGTTLAQNVPNPVYGPIRFTFTGNDRFAYIGTGPGVSAPVGAFERKSDGTLESLSSFDEQDPALPVTGADWWPYDIQADPTNHLAIALGGFLPEWDGPVQINPFQLASYTVDEHGNISTTNTTADMPVFPGVPERLSMSPSGKFLAVASSNSFFYGGQYYDDTLGVFHFNGADPITPYRENLLSDDDGVFLIKWDNNDHLYATTYGLLHVFTVTSKKISEAAGSPYAIPPPCINAPTGESLCWNLTVVPRPK